MTPSTLIQSTPENRSRDYAHLPPAHQRWCDDVPTAMHHLAVACERAAIEIREEGLVQSPLRRVTEKLETVLGLLSGRVDLLTEFRAWPLAEVAEKLSKTWLQTTDEDAAAIDPSRDMFLPIEQLRTAWGKYCNPPEPQVIVKTPIESLAALDREKVPDRQIAQIFATGDPTEDEAEFGPWVVNDAPLYSEINDRRLAAARSGKAQTPRHRTTTEKPEGWPAKAPRLMYLPQVGAALAE
jgi:hypothetical protein